MFLSLKSIVPELVNGDRGSRTLGSEVCRAAHELLALHLFDAFLLSNRSPGLQKLGEAGDPLRKEPGLLLLRSSAPRAHDRGVRGTHFPRAYLQLNVQELQRPSSTLIDVIKATAQADWHARAAGHL